MSFNKKYAMKNILNFKFFLQGKIRTTLHEHLLQKEDPLTFDEYTKGRWRCDNCSEVRNGTSHPFHCIQGDKFDLCDSCAHANMIKGKILCN